VRWSEDARRCSHRARRSGKGQRPHPPLRQRRSVANPNGRVRQSKVTRRSSLRA